VANVVLHVALQREGCVAHVTNTLFARQLVIGAPINAA
jgi:hypothetical protein